MQTGENEVSNQNIPKMSHKKWRGLLKKQRKKLKRKQEAQKRDEIESQAEKEKESSPSFIAQLKEEAERERLCEQREEAERIYLNKLWEERERLAQEEWKKKKEWEAKEKIRREETERKIREEWEERQRKENEEEKEKEKKKEKQEELLRQATANENKDGPWHNPIATVIQGKERETCMFFSKTGTCRFGDRCSRGHPHPEISNTLLFPGMYTHFELEQGLRDEYDTDLILEYEEGELYQNFKDFYEDIVPEFKAIGKVMQVKVCCNYEPHLRGNVYVQYNRNEDAQQAFMKFNGRFYGGKQLSCEYVDIKKWKSAICGLFGSGRCPKGRNCNFLHVFRNPNHEFRNADMDFFDRSIGSGREGRNHTRDRSKRSHRDRSKSRENYRSRSKSPRRRKRSYSRDRKYSRSRSRDRTDRKKHRRRSRSRSRYSHTNRSRSRSRSDSRSRSKLNKSRGSMKERSEENGEDGKEKNHEEVPKVSERLTHSNKWDSDEDITDSGKGREKSSLLVNNNADEVKFDERQHDKIGSLEKYYDEQDSNSESDNHVKSSKKRKKHKKHKHKSGSRKHELKESDT